MNTFIEFCVDYTPNPGAATKAEENAVEAESDVTAGAARFAELWSAWNGAVFVFAMRWLNSLGYDAYECVTLCVYIYIHIMYM